MPIDVCKFEDALMKSKSKVLNTVTGSQAKYNMKDEILEILKSDYVAPDLDDYPNVRDMSRDELAKALWRDARKCAIHKTRERQIKSLLSENTEPTRS